MTGIATVDFDPWSCCADSRSLRLRCRAPGLAGAARCPAPISLPNDGPRARSARWDVGLRAFPLHHSGRPRPAFPLHPCDASRSFVPYSRPVRVPSNRTFVTPVAFAGCVRNRPTAYGPSGRRRLLPLLGSAPNCTRLCAALGDTEPVVGGVFRRPSLLLTCSSLEFRRASMPFSLCLLPPSAIFVALCASCPAVVVSRSTGGRSLSASRGRHDLIGRGSLAAHVVRRWQGRRGRSARLRRELTLADGGIAVPKSGMAPTIRHSFRERATGRTVAGVESLVALDAVLLSCGNCPDLYSTGHYPSARLLARLRMV